MFNVGDMVRVKNPFGYTFADVYLVVSIDADGVHFLDGIEGGFDIIFLESV